MAVEIEKLSQRIENLENTTDAEIITLVEILANITFFGQMKKTLCQHAKNGQCHLYIVDVCFKDKIPFTEHCRIKDCKEYSLHSHIVLSNITCGLCHETSVGEISGNGSKQS